MKLVIFDCDGTLVDSQNMIAASMKMAFAGLDLAWPGREKTLTIVGLSLPEAMHVLAPGESENTRRAIIAGYKSVFQTLRHDPANREPLFDGARMAIETLSGRGDMVLGIATGKSQRGVRAMLEREGFDGLFATIQTADDAPSKPHPAMVHQAMNETGMTANQTVVIGDTSYDMEMARAADARAIGVGWGYHPSDALALAGAGVVLNHFNELDEALDAIWAN